MADADQRDSYGTGFGDAWFFVQNYDLDPHPDECPMKVGEEVAFLWHHHKNRMLATDVLRLRWHTPRVFLVHASEDKPFARRLAKAIQKAGASVWFDEWEILVGDSIVTRINEGLKECDYLVIILSKRSVESSWVERELSAGLMRELLERSIVVLPVLKEACSMPALIMDRYYADCSQDFEKGVTDLINSIKARSCGDIS